LVLVFTRDDNLRAYLPEKSARETLGEKKICPERGRRGNSKKKIFYQKPGGKTVLQGVEFFHKSREAIRGKSAMGGRR